MPSDNPGATLTEAEPLPAAPRLGQNLHNIRADITGSARRHAAAFVSDVEATARRNPMGTLLAALSLGVIVGMTVFSR
jgi:hypothetical protein